MFESYIFNQKQPNKKGEVQEAVVLVLLYSSAFQLTSDYRLNSLMIDSHCFSTTVAKTEHTGTCLF